MWPSRVKVGLCSTCNSVLGERFTWGLNPTIDASVSKREDARSLPSIITLRGEHLLTVSYHDLLKLALFQYHVERGTGMETKKAWVDFNLIKAAVTMEMLVVQYGITGLAKNGDELRGVCPIHEGKSKREFAVNLSKNTFCCFAPTCKARGNVLDFVARMEHCTVRDAALKLDEWFSVTKQEAGESSPAAESPPADKAKPDAVTILIAEVETHVSRSLHHATLAEAKFSALKQLLAAR